MTATFRQCNAEIDGHTCDRPRSNKTHRAAPECHTSGSIEWDDDAPFARRHHPGGADLNDLARALAAEVERLFPFDPDELVAASDAKRELRHLAHFVMCETHPPEDNR